MKSILFVLIVQAGRLLTLIDLWHQPQQQQQQQQQQQVHQQQRSNWPRIISQFWENKLFWFVFDFATNLDLWSFSKINKKPVWKKFLKAVNFVLETQSPDCFILITTVHTLRIKNICLSNYRVVKKECDFNISLKFLISTFLPTLMFNV